MENFTVPDLLAQLAARGVLNANGTLNAADMQLYNGAAVEPTNDQAVPMDGVQEQAVVARDVTRGVVHEANNRGPSGGLDGAPAPSAGNATAAGTGEARVGLGAAGTEEARVGLGAVPNGREGNPPAVQQMAPAPLTGTGLELLLAGMAASEAQLAEDRVVLERLQAQYRTVVEPLLAARQAALNPIEVAHRDAMAPVDLAHRAAVAPVEASMRRHEAAIEDKRKHIDLYLASEARNRGSRTTFGTFAQSACTSAG